MHRYQTLYNMHFSDYWIVAKGAVLWQSSSGLTITLDVTNTIIYKLGKKKNIQGGHYKLNS